MVSNGPSEIGYTFPLYLYPSPDEFKENAKRRPNLKSSIVNEIAAKTGLVFTEEKDDTENSFAPIDLLDYIYAVLHSPAYRQKYREFLKIDFPRIPYPQDVKSFFALAAIGEKLRKTHLMENINIKKNKANFPKQGDNKINKLSYGNTKVFINETQYFDSVLRDEWEFFIGGYQPAQKWLKDRKGRKLSFDDIEHYQKIISAIRDTIDLQTQIDKIFTA
jgi:predicted helicase